jgi:hypothetical protein
MRHQIEWNGAKLQKSPLTLRKYVAIRFRVVCANHHMHRTSSDGRAGRVTTFEILLASAAAAAAPRIIKPVQLECAEGAFFFSFAAACMQPASFSYVAAAAAAAAEQQQ